MIGAEPLERRYRRPRYNPLGNRRGPLPARPDALHPSWCDCRACTKPAEDRRIPRGCSISFLVLVGLGAATGFLFIADAIAAGPGLQVMAGQPGKQP